MCDGSSEAGGNHGEMASNDPAQGTVCGGVVLRFPGRGVAPTGGTPDGGSMNDLLT